MRGKGGLNISLAKNIENQENVKIFYEIENLFR